MYDRRHLFVELPPNVGGMPLWATFRPYPQQLFRSPFQPWDSPFGFSSYNALQITLNKRFSRGIDWLANYAFSKSLGNIDSDFQTWGQNGGQPLDRCNLKLEKSVTSWDQTHVVKIGSNYELPFGRGRMIGSGMAPLVNAVAGGWNLVAARLPERSRVIESIAKKAGRHDAQVTKNFKEEKLCFRLHAGPVADHM
jgi:hypothetical protein